MPRLKSFLSLKSYRRYLKRRIENHEARIHPNYRGVVRYPPGHFYSPLLDIESMLPSHATVEPDGVDYWEHIDLRLSAQRTFYETTVERFAPPPFPRVPTPGHRYYWENTWFPFADAFTLAGMIRAEKPKRIVEVGSGFSSAVMLDTLEQFDQSAMLTFVEPSPERLLTLLSSGDLSSTRLFAERVQDVPLTVFEELGRSDILFIDSSHVAKVGSDVSFLLLRILPRLQAGVLVHFHDVFFPYSYPREWISEGRAYNESLFVRTFLLGNQSFEITAFNSFAGWSFPEVFRNRCDGFLKDHGASLWLRKIR